MSRDAFIADEVVSEGEQDRTGGIQRGVESWKIGKLQGHEGSLQSIADS